MLERQSQARRIDNTLVIEIEDAQTQVADRIEEIRLLIASDVRSGALEFPPLPQVAVELGRLASTPDPDMTDAMRLVERDNQLAGRVLRVASSPALGGRPVTDLRDAVVRLGVNGLRDLAFAASMGKVFRCPPLDELVKAEMLHAFVVAIASARACRMLGVGDKYGFLCGLFHDVGRMAVLMALAQYGRHDARLWDPGFATAACDALHTELGPLVLSSWGVHTMVKGVAEHHHRPEKAGAAMPLCLAVATVDAADEIVTDDEAERAQALCNLPVGYRAGLSPAQLQELAALVHLTRHDDVVARLMS